ncbi:hypothetical protein LQZ19_12570 [Treponema primitia]|uniref:hypothetical protein n=1 Tax=Treponema primitia TaxID=88058 RepID=UPI00397FD266
MKKLMCLTILLSSAILAYSQNRADTTLYIEPISGGSASDRSFFDENLKMEVNAAGYALIDDLLDAIYSISGAIAPEDDGYVLSITLSNVEESREMVTQELFYVKVEESYEILPFLVWQMLANAPFLVTEAPPPPPPRAYNTDTESSNNSGRMAPIVNLVNAVPDDDSWKNKWIYLGAKFGVSPRFYTSSGEDVNAETITFEVGVDMGIQVLDFLVVQLEADFGMDNADYQKLKYPTIGEVTKDPDDITYKTSILSFPLLIKGVLKPGRSFLVEPYGGAYLNLPFGTETASPVGGWLAGIDFGVKVGGNGYIFFDFRYANDLGNTKVKDKRVEYNRNIVSVTAGYRVGFLNRKQSASRFRGARY